jgi:hypothetical protein
MMGRRSLDESEEAEARKAYAEGKISSAELMNFLRYLASKGKQVQRNVGKGTQYRGPRL